MDEQKNILTKNVYNVQSNIDEPDMQDTAEEAGTNS